MIFLAKLGIGVLGTAIVGGAAISSEGFIHVKVHEKAPGGTNVNIFVPAALATTALHFIPDHQFADRSNQLRDCLPIIDAAIPALDASPDGVLVEVIDPNEHVRITKSGSSIVVDVNDPGEVVHVSVPLGTVQGAIHRVAEAKAD